MHKSLLAFLLIFSTSLQASLSSQMNMMSPSTISGGGGCVGDYGYCGDMKRRDALRMLEYRKYDTYYNNNKVALLKRGRTKKFFNNTVSLLLKTKGPARYVLPFKNTINGWIDSSVSKLHSKPVIDRLKHESVEIRDYLESIFDKERFTKNELDDFLGRMDEYQEYVGAIKSDPNINSEEKKYIAKFEKDIELLNRSVLFEIFTKKNTSTQGSDNSLSSKVIDDLSKKHQIELSNMGQNLKNIESRMDDIYTDLSKRFREEEDISKGQNQFEYDQAVISEATNLYANTIIIASKVGLVEGDITPLINTAQSLGTIATAVSMYQNNAYMYAMSPYAMAAVGVLNLMGSGPLSSKDDGINAALNNIIQHLNSISEQLTDLTNVVSDRFDNVLEHLYAQEFRVMKEFSKLLEGQHNISVNITSLRADIEKLSQKLDNIQLSYMNAEIINFYQILKTKDNVCLKTVDSSRVQECIDFFKELLTQYKNTYNSVFTGIKYGSDNINHNTSIDNMTSDIAGLFNHYLSPNPPIENTFHLPIYDEVVMRFNTFLTHNSGHTGNYSTDELKDLIRLIEGQQANFISYFNDPTNFAKTIRKYLGGLAKFEEAVSLEIEKQRKESILTSHDKMYNWHLSTLNFKEGLKHRSSKAHKANSLSMYFRNQASSNNSQAEKNFYENKLKRWEKKFLGSKTRYLNRIKHLSMSNVYWIKACPNSEHLNVPSFPIEAEYLRSMMPGVVHAWELVNLSDDHFSICYDPILEDVKSKDFGTNGHLDLGYDSRDSKYHFLIFSYGLNGIKYERHQLYQEFSQAYYFEKKWKGKARDILKPIFYPFEIKQDKSLYVHHGASGNHYRFDIPLHFKSKRVQGYSYTLKIKLPNTAKGEIVFTEKVKLGARNTHNQELNKKFTKEVMGRFKNEIANHSGCFLMTETDGRDNMDSILSPFFYTMFQPIKDLCKGPG